jgi:RND family efflux transporter MFP subunit
VVKVPLADDDVARIRQNDKATITFSGLKPVEAAVSRIAAKADGRTGAFDVELRVTATDEPLRSGMIGQARIAPGNNGFVVKTIAIPAMALLEGRGDAAAVFVVDDKGRAQRVSVRIGGFADGQVLIAEGIASGMRVVTSGAPYLRNGQAVTITSGVSGS